ncbi:MAG: HAD family hydrolase [Candidatus Thorarchaeota archaeon]
MKYKGIIFDFNGVLLSDSHLHEKAWKKFSKQLRGVSLSLEEISIHVHGRTNKYILEYILNRSITSQELNSLSFQKEALYQNLCLQHMGEFHFSHGTVDLLDFLNKNDIPSTIATASDENNLKFFIEHLRLDKWFDISKIVYDDGSFLGKLDMYLKAAENLELFPKQCIVFEDSKTGIIAAYKAKIGKIIGFGPKEKHEFLLNLKGVSQVISSFDEFKKEELLMFSKK